MEQAHAQTLVAAGKLLAETLHGTRVTPLAAFESLAALAVSETEKDALVRPMIEHWAALNGKNAESGAPELDARMPLILSRGYDEMVPEQELKRFLPEEKILINRESFHARLDSLDFSTLDAASERTVLEQLRAEAIGLSPEDVILYYNLIKVNKLAGRARQGTTASVGTPRGEQATRQPISPAELFALAMKAFGVSQEHVLKANSGKQLDMEMVYEVMRESMQQRRVAPEVYAHYLGKRTDKYVRAVRDFVDKFITQRGENPADYAAYHALYLLLGGAQPKLLDRLDASPPLAAYLGDRMGRIRSIYYVALLFIHTFSYALCSQTYDIAQKYGASPPEQQAKLRKLYSSSERLGLLLSNATNMANQRVAEYKGEAREIQGQFRQFLSSHRELLDSADLFETQTGT
ncbi:MAG: hypothetical protein JXM71_02740 [Spirochaetales bacterium]|nr:hypothetical protein [Spirochaetales bacterium]